MIEGGSSRLGHTLLRDQVKRKKGSLTLAKYRSLVLFTVLCHSVSALRFQIPDTQSEYPGLGYLTILLASVE